MSFESKIKKYARLAVKTGVNIQEGQLLVINGDVDCAWYIREVVKAAYEAGAGEVVVQYSDAHVTKMRYEYANDEALSNFANWQYVQKEENIQRGCAFLSIGSPDPTLLASVDAKKIRMVQMAMSKAMQPLRYYTAANKGQWSVELLPNPTWAKMVYPELAEDEAMAKLWDAIFACCRVGEDNDPVADWTEHSAKVVNRGKLLNEYQFKQLHFKNSLGTDVVVELVNDHEWAGGQCFTPEGVGFVPNLPTEEIFCMPHKDRVNGKVVATKPLSIQGKLVEDFWFEFKDGKVVNYGASANLESLESLLNMDEGAKHLGEVALISHDSPISNTNTLFYNGLIDENASCHLALGTCYPYNIRGGSDMPQDELVSRGANFSMTHCDFMFGSADMSIIGIDKDDNEVVVFENGNFAF